MPDLLNVFLVLVMVVSVWPSLLHVVGYVASMSPSCSSKWLYNVRLGLVGNKRAPHPADPPVCMAKLIMLRHRMQQSNARKAQQRIAPLASKTHAYVHSRHRSAQSWHGQLAYNNPTIGARRWGSVPR